MTPTIAPAHADAVLFAGRNPNTLTAAERKRLDAIDSAARLIAAQRRIERAVIRAAQHLRAAATIEDRHAPA